MGVLGGATSPWGALIGAALVTLLPELLRGLGHYRPLINGVILIVIILYSPKGLWELLQFAMRRTAPKHDKLAMLTLSSVSKHFGGLRRLARYQFDDS